jgi:hypothetical protein
MVSKQLSKKFMIGDAAIDEFSLWVNIFFETTA